MARGFIKEVGGNMRHRIVKAGLNADNMATAPNDVVFDTVDLGTLSILYSGVYRFNYPGTAAPVTQKIRSWDLSYVPLCTFQFRNASVSDWRNAYYIRAVTPYQQIIVDTTGITVTMSPAANYTDIRYQVYRLPVT